MRPAGPDDVDPIAVFQTAQAFYRRHGFIDDGGRMVCEDTGLRELRFTSLPLRVLRYHRPRATLC